MPRNPNRTDYSGGFPANFDTFSSITDPRDGGHTLHHFGEILFIAFAGLHDEVRDQFDFARRQLTPTLAPPQLDSARWSFASTEESGHARTEKRQSSSVTT